LSGDKVWHDDDAFWRTFGPWMFTEKRLEGTAAEVEQMIALLGVAPGARILDLCCGPGRHSLELARRGYAVTGVDRTAEYIRRGRRKAKKEGLSVEFVRADMREFVRSGAFDAAINMFTAFGYFRDPEEDRSVLRNLCASLAGGGRLLMELMGKEVLARIFRERDWQERDGILMLEERKVSEDWSWMENRWIVIHGTDRREFSVSHRLYSAAELRRLLVECGFAEVRIFGDLAGSLYDHKASRLVALATTPGGGKATP
jgi:SAM-dependent methyltransferase